MANEYCDLCYRDHAAAIEADPAPRAAVARLCRPTTIEYRSPPFPAPFARRSEVGLCAPCDAAHPEFRAAWVFNRDNPPPQARRGAAGNDAAADALRLAEIAADGQAGYRCGDCGEIWSEEDLVQVRECPHCETYFDGSEGRNCPDCNRPVTRKITERGCPECMSDECEEVAAAPAAPAPPAPPAP